MSDKESTSKAIATQWSEQNPVLASRGITESGWNALKTSVFPGAADDSILMAVDYCASRQLDVMMKPVHIVPMYVIDKQTETKGMRDVIMPGVGLYRIQAERSGNYAGIDAPKFGPMVTKNFEGVEVTFPEFCTITMYKQIKNGKLVAYSATEYWEENYATKGRDSIAPNSMWLKRPRAQLVKCTEAQVLRRGWPEIGQDPTAEEMEGKTFDSMKVVNSTTQQNPSPQNPSPQTPSSQNAGSSETETNKIFPESTFNQRFGIWEKDIADGKITVDTVVNFVESKGYSLTKDQSKRLNSIKTIIEG